MPVIKLCPKLILEGTRLTGKTDLALALNESSRITGVRKYRYHSPIVSAEWNGFTESPYVTDYSLDEQVDFIADWLEATGGLNATKTAPERKRKLVPTSRGLAEGSWIGQQSRIANSI
jgi:hypothetical protein